MSGAAGVIATRAGMNFDNTPKCVECNHAYWIHDKKGKGRCRAISGFLKYCKCKAFVEIKDEPRE